MTNLNFTCPICRSTAVTVTKQIRTYYNRRPLRLACEECNTKFNLVIEGHVEELSHFLGTDRQWPQAERVGLQARPGRPRKQ